MVSGVFRALSLSYLGAHPSQGYSSWRDVAVRTVSEETIAVLGVRGGGRWAKYFPPSSSRKTLQESDVGWRSKRVRACLAVASHMHAQKTGRPVHAVLGGCTT